MSAYREREESQTEFNSNVATLKRIDRMLIECHEFVKAAVSDGYDISYLKLWHASIVDLFKEIDPKLKGDKGKNSRKLIKLLFSKTRSMPALLMTRGPPNNRSVEVNPIAFKQRINLYNQIEIELRRLADKRGMLLTDKRSDFFAAGDVD